MSNGDPILRYYEAEMRHARISESKSKERK